MRLPLFKKNARSDPVLGPSDETPLLQNEATGPLQSKTPPSPPPVSWASMPRKGQLAVIVLARLAEPLSERSLASYLFFQLRWFNPDLDPSEIPKQAGYLTAVFAAAQCLTAMWWGRAADSRHLGRKRVLIIGLSGSAMSALGMGFSKSLTAAFCFRFCAGALNGNIGVLRTMVSEIVADKRYQSRAFLLLPMCFNVGVIIGPLLTGFLADPVNSLPGLFGPGSVFGGANGVQWLKDYPFALPNLFCFSVLSMATLLIIMGLDETHPQLRHRPDPGRRLGKLIMSKALRVQDENYKYDLLNTDQASPVPNGLLDEENDGTSNEEPEQKEQTPFRAILTRNVCLNMLQRFLQSLHVAAFNSILFTLLPIPVSENHDMHLPFRFTGGLGLSSKKMGFANTTIGMIGLPLQIILYPRVIGYIGVRKSYQVFLPLSVIAYFSLPYLVLLPDNAALIWTCLTAVLTMNVMSRTFVNPATMMLLNDSAPSPDLLGTVHGLATSISSIGRVLGPTMGGATLGWGLAHNIVGLPLWLLGILAVINWATLYWIEDVRMDE